MANAKQQQTSGGGAAKTVETLVRPVIEEMGLRLWDVRFEKEGPDWYLRVLIDRDDPLDTDTCAEVTHAIDPLIDEADPIEQSYFLEVGSPGLGRKLTRPEHYEQLKGQKCAVHLIRPDEAGNRDIAGTLEGLDADGNVTFKTEAGDYTFPVKSAGFVKLCDDENLFDSKQRSKLRNITFGRKKGKWLLQTTNFLKHSQHLRKSAACPPIT